MASGWVDAASADENGMTKAMPKSPTSPATFEALREAARQGRWTTMRAWMWEHHDAFAQVLRDTRKPNWAAIAVQLGEIGLTSQNGTPPTRETSRHTWAWVRKNRWRLSPEAGVRAQAQIPHGNSERVSASVENFSANPRSDFQFRTLKKGNGDT